MYGVSRVHAVEDDHLDLCLQVVMLFTSVTSDKLIRVNQERLEQLFYVRGLPLKQVDAADADNKALREALFAISGLKSVYPQVFFENTDGSFSFVGDFKRIHTINEHNDHDASFDKTFMCVTAYAAVMGPERMAWLETLPAVVPTAASATSPKESAEPTWERCTSKVGDEYWFCRRTGESSWVDPSLGMGPGGVWVPQIDKKGRTFYYNRKTGKSSWTVPQS